MSWTPQYNKLGPPKHLKAPKYHPHLELLETAANKALMGEYEQDICNYLALVESSSYINCTMIDLQPEVQWYMRPFLLDFLVEIHQSFRLHPQTLFLAVNIIDKYCSKRVVFKKHYQLVGSTALWLAAKYEDKKSRVPTLKELTIMCRDAYDPEMFVQMEKHILSTLEWSLAFTSLEDCLQISLNNSTKFLNETPMKIGLKSYKKPLLQTKIETLARFFCELSLYERNYLQFPSSLISIACHLLASRILSSDSAVNSFEFSVRQYLENYREIDDDATFDEDLENSYPHVTQPFLSEFDRDATVNHLIIICAMLVNSAANCSHALMSKYQKFGQDYFDYIQLVKDFMAKYQNIIQILPETEQFKNVEDYEMTQELSYAGSYLLGIAASQYEQPQHQHQPAQQQEFQQPYLPMFGNLLNTPPSASSTISSIFSNADFSGSNYSTSSLVMTPTSASSPMDANYYHQQQQYTKSNVFYPHQGELKKPGEIRDAEYASFKRQSPLYGEATGSSPLAQRSTNKMNLMI